MYGHFAPEIFQTQDFSALVPKCHGHFGITVNIRETLALVPKFLWNTLLPVPKCLDISAPVILRTQKCLAYGSAACIRSFSSEIGLCKFCNISVTVYLFKNLLLVRDSSKRPLRKKWCVISQSQFSDYYITINLLLSWWLFVIFFLYFHVCMDRQKSVCCVCVMCDFVCNYLCYMPCIVSSQNV